MIRSAIYSRVLRVLDTNSTAYTSANFNNDLNEAIAIRAMQILRFNGYKHISNTQAYTEFVSITGLSEGDSGFNGEYSFPSDLLDIERIEVTFNGTDWYVLSKENGKLYDISQSGTSEQNQTDIQNNYDTSDPYALIRNNSIFIRPLNTGSTQTSGLWIFYSARQTDLSSDSESPFFEANLHQALIYDCAELEMMSHPDKYDGTRERRILRKKGEIDKEFNNFYRRRLKVLDRIQSVHESFN